MKQLGIVILVLLLLLCGCGAEPTNTQPSTTAPAPTEPGLYEPGSSAEVATNGAVRCYGTVKGVNGKLLPMGNDLLLITEEANAISATRLTGVNARPVYAGWLQEAVELHVDNNVLAYYDPGKSAVVFLDAMLQEAGSVALPADLVHAPVISPDLKRAYYCLEGEIRYTQLDSGISGLLRSRGTAQLIPVGLVDSALQCLRISESGQRSMEYISTADGRTLGQSPVLELTAKGDCYFAMLTEDGYEDYLFGHGNGQVRAFYPADGSEFIPLLSHDRVLGVRKEEMGIALDLYELESGKRAASVTLPEINAIPEAVLSAGGDTVWFLGETEGSLKLFSWSAALSPVDDAALYTGRRITADQPDTEGLKAFKERAQHLSETYGLTIRIWEKQPSPEGYLVQSLYRTELLESTLDTLESFLPLFPEDFFANLEDGKLTVELVRKQEALSQDADPEQGSLACWIDGQGRIFLACSENAQMDFCSALSNILDAHIYAGSLKYDDWDSLNPKGFSYDGNYASYKDRETNKWLEGEARAFVDAYSMTFAREDRSRIFALAMAEGNEALFASETMRNKLERICAAIRDAFDWKKDERSFTWEQYLNQ